MKAAYSWNRGDKRKDEIIYKKNPNIYFKEYENIQEIEFKKNEVTNLVP